jgi:hypothetical protein
MLTDLPEVPVVALVGENAGQRQVRGRAAMLDLFRNEMRAHPRARLATAADSGYFLPWPTREDA